MTLNPLNMQMSVPRIPEASNIQQQAMQKPVVDQTELAKQTIKDIEHNRTQTQKTNETEKSTIRDQQQSRNQEQQSQQEKNKKNLKQDPSNEPKSIHPYKGHSIDIKL